MEYAAVWRFRRAAKAARSVESFAPSPGSLPKDLPLQVLAGKRLLALVSEKYQVPLLPAAIIGVVGFAVSLAGIAVLYVSTWIVLHPVLHRPDPEDAQAVRELLEKRPDDTTIAVLSFLFAVAIGVATHRVVRSPMSPHAFFQTSFFAGLALLGYSLWVTLASLHTVRLLSDESLVQSGPATSLLICIVTIPGALVLMLSALIAERRQLASVRGPSRHGL